MALRVFQLVPVLEKVVDSKDISKHRIESLDCWQDDLYVGTKSGIVVHYLLVHGESPTGKVTCQTIQKGKVSLAGGRKDCRIEQLMVVPAERKLLVVSGGLVTILDMDDVTVTSKAKERDFRLLCRDEAHDLAGRNTSLSVVKKKDRGIYPYEFFGGALAPLRGSKIRDLEDDRFRGVISMARDGNKVCVVQETPSKTKLVAMINLIHGSVNTVWEADVPVAPLVRRLGPNEFVFTQSFDDGASETTTLGTVITSEGVPSGKNPIQMNFVPLAAACTHPYVLMLGNNGTIVVHSLLDQKEKQTIHFPDGKFLCDTGGKVIVAGANSIYLLDQVSFQSQIDDLLKEHRVTEALNLAEVTFSTSRIDLDAEEFQRQREGMLALQRRAGLTYLTMGRFADGFDLLAASNTDPREMIALFPDLLPKSSRYSTIVSTTGLTDIHQIVKDPAKMREAHKALANFLTVMRSDHVPQEWASDIDTVLAVLFGVLSPDKLIKFISRQHNVVLHDAIEHLEKHQRFHAVALLHAQNGAPSSALNIWKRLDAGELSDQMYAGADYAIDFLVALKPTPEMEPEDRDKLTDSIFIHAEWMLRKDPLAVRIFTKRSPEEHHDLFRPDTVLEFLRPFGYTPVVEYLEFLVNELKNKSERYHTRLAMLYVEVVQRALIEEAARKNSGATNIQKTKQFVMQRAKLKKILLSSDHYRIETLLERVQNTELFNERAILHGKQGDHMKAIDLLVHKLKNFEAAEQYCLDTTAGQDRQSRQKVFLTLLKVYLVPESRGQFIEHAINILNEHATDLDTHEVLPLLPQDWSIGTIESFLIKSMRRSLHTQRTSRIQHGLARQSWVQAKAERSNFRVKGLMITDRSTCSECGKRFQDTDPIAIDAIKMRPICRVCAKIPKPERSSRNR